MPDPKSTRTPDLKISRHGQMTEAFELLAQGVGPFIDDRMSVYFADDLSWEDAASNRMGRANEHGATDPLFQLLVLRRFWGPVFSEFFGEDLRSLVAQLIEARNLWAHFSLPDDTAYLDRILLSIERLMSPVAPESAIVLRRIRTRLKNPWTDDVAGDSQEPVDLVALRSQLGETEGAFQQLQTDFAAINEQLTIARKASAGKQLRLNMLERELLETTGQAAQLEHHLAFERNPRQRLEWIFVVFIAVMLLVMVLLVL
ncbi:MAG: Swt1 family HEPN domain-containing protein [Actinomycetota bacterium]|nr:Swt1 family HEPN domain-containing protein [Actinomycetota bacterium]